MFSVCVSLGKQSSAHFFFFLPQFPGGRTEKDIPKKQKQESANAKKHECVCICVLFFFGGGGICVSPVKDRVMEAQVRPWK